VVATQAASRGDKHARLRRLDGESVSVWTITQDEDTDIYSTRNYMNGGSTFRTTLLAIDHTAYHLGEFVTGRQILGHWHSRLDQ